MAVSFFIADPPPEQPVTRGPGLPSLLTLVLPHSDRAGPGNFYREARPFAKAEKRRWKSDDESL